MGLRQYQPNAAVYARGRRWKVIGVDLSSPWNPSGGQAAWQYRARCGTCGMVRDAQGQPKCPRWRHGRCGRRTICGRLRRFPGPDRLHGGRRRGGSWGGQGQRAGPSVLGRRAGRRSVAASPTAGNTWSGARRNESTGWLNEARSRMAYVAATRCARIAANCWTSRRRNRPVAGGPGCPRGPVRDRTHTTTCRTVRARSQPVGPVALYTERRVETTAAVVPLAGSGGATRAGASLRAWTLGWRCWPGPSDCSLWALARLRVNLRGAAHPAWARRATGTRGYPDDYRPESGWQRLPGAVRAAAAGGGGGGPAPPRPRGLRDRLLPMPEQLRQPAAPRPSELAADHSHSGGPARGHIEQVPLAAADFDDPRPAREAFEAGVGSPLEFRCWTLLQAMGLTPLKQFPIADTAGSRLLSRSSTSRFLEPADRRWLYVDGVSIHLGEVLAAGPTYRGSAGEHDVAMDDLATWPQGHRW